MIAGVLSIVKCAKSKGLRRGLRGDRRAAVDARAAALLILALLPPAAGPRLHAGAMPDVRGSQDDPGRTIHVPSGGDFQAALNRAHPGDMIVLEAGAIYSGDFKLPNKLGDSYVTITSSALASLPPEGTRVSPADSKNMPKLVAAKGEPALTAAGGAHHYRFVGIEMTPEPTATMTYDIVRLGLGEEVDPGTLPHDIVFDRVYVHGGPMQTVRRGISLNGAAITVENSTISDIKGLAQDTQAIEGWNGPGPFKILNNYLEAAGENIMFGGVLARIPNLVPSDIEIRRNYLCKPIRWRKDEPSYAGEPWTVKNLLELKNAQRVVVDSNVMEHNWAMAQDGTAVLLTPRAELGRVPWAVVQDVTFTHNLIQHVGAGFTFLGADNEDKMTQGVIRLHHVRVQDNLILDVGRPNWTGRGSLFLFLGGPDGITVDHNTGFAEHAIAVADGAPTTGAVFTNNIVLRGQFGFVGSGTQEGSPTLNHYLPGAVFRSNVIIGGGSSYYPRGNFFPRSASDAGFVDYAAGNLALAPNSRYRNSGTDGKDIGADVGAVEAAVAGVVEGRAAPGSSR